MSNSKITFLTHLYRTLERLRSQAVLEADQMRRVYDAAIPISDVVGQSWTPVQRENLATCFTHYQRVHFNIVPDPNLLAPANVFWIEFVEPVAGPNQNQMRGLVILKDDLPDVWDWYQQASQIQKELDFLTDGLNDAVGSITKSSFALVPYAIPEIRWPGVTFSHGISQQQALKDVRDYVLKRLPKGFIPRMQEALATASLLEERSCYAWVGWRASLHT